MVKAYYFGMVKQDNNQFIGGQVCIEKVCCMHQSLDFRHMWKEASI